jgi:hypothetical protein
MKLINVEKIRLNFRSAKRLSDGMVYVPVRDVLRMIRKVPESVVRCENCARRVPGAENAESVICAWMHNACMPRDGFCSYGVKRDEA